MPYVKVVLMTLIPALFLGAAAGALAVLSVTLFGLRPEDLGAVYATGVSTALSWGAVFFLLVAPLAVVRLYVVRRRRRA